MGILNQNLSTFMVISLRFCLSMVLDKVVQKIRTHILPSIIFPEIVPL